MRDTFTIGCEVSAMRLPPSKSTVPIFYGVVVEEPLEEEAQKPSGEVRMFINDTLTYVRVCEVSEEAKRYKVN